MKVLKPMKVATKSLGMKKPTHPAAKRSNSSKGKKQEIIRGKEPKKAFGKKASAQKKDRPTRTPPRNLKRVLKGTALVKKRVVAMKTASAMKILKHGIIAT